MPIPLIALALAAQDGVNRTVPTPSQGATVNGQPPATMVFEPIAMAIVAWDADGDGRTTLAELRRGVAASFAAIAPDAGGSIGYIGYSDWALRWLGDRNALPSPFEVDTNGDDRITLAELQAAVGAAFDRLDRDHDGAVTRAEALTIRSNAVGGHDGSGAHRGKPPR